MADEQQTQAARRPGDPSAPLKDYWSTGPGGREIGWGTPGDFMRCVVRLGKYMSPENARGYCAERHHDALGIWPAEHKGSGAPDQDAAGDAG